MRKCLMLFNSSGDKVRTVEDVGTVGNYDGEIVAYGIDGTTICRYSSKGITHRAVYTDEPEKLHTLEDVDRYREDQERAELDAMKERREWKARDDFDFLTHRRFQLLDLIEYNERELEKMPKFSKEWERLQKKVITLENQLRTTDAKRDKAYSEIKH